MAEKLTGTAITGVGPYYQDVADAIRQFGAKNYAAALEHLEAAKKSTPRLAPPEIMMAALHLDADQPGPAIAFLERAILRAPQDPEAFLILAERAMAEGRYSEAEFMYQRAVKNVESYTDNPRRKQDLQVRAVSGASSVDEARANAKEAKPKLESLIKLDPRNAAGSLYDLYPAEGKPLKPAGEWNEGRILIHDQVLEHWLTQPEARGWSPARLRTAGQHYEHGLDPQPGAERYWLVLPDRS